MAMVHTVTGAIHSAELGFTLMHEHILIANWSIARAAPRWNMRHISDEVLPALRVEGVSEEQIEALWAANPRRVFERQGSYRA